ncbi:hypothetical protein TEQG_06232 [Trichophyton equinum CBS 127.97]|uniref:Zn(2)-C6 fungal-type domain-containing protein n=1 Tax=Trichophyton equinum (strain ATCC MYA-4606 / CBS 127.97) TaxID=559882 RepID=F2PZK6_TRIEC|nr:hypothetical protein TEQG_06232 [Trichophyton equinum CBS 127.97]
MADIAQKKQPKQRKSFQIETRFGGARELKSRKDRPCDACRQRKTACVIVTKPPCRFCESKCVTCSFISTPKPRRRSPAKSQEKGDEHTTSTTSPPVNMATNSGGPTQHSESPVYQSPPDHLSMVGVGALSPVSMLSVSDHEQYTTPTSIPGYPATLASPHHPSAIPVSGQVYHHLPEYSYFANPTPPPHPISPATDSFNHITGHAAHLMGMRGEQQDMGALPSFRSGAIDQSGHHMDINFNHVEPADPAQNLPPDNFSLASAWFCGVDRGKSTTSHKDDVEDIVSGQADSLVRLYFVNVHPAFPVLSKGRFLREYAQDKYSIPLTLRGAVYALAAYWLPIDSTSLHDGIVFRQMLFEHVHASLQKELELESPQLSTLQACLLLLYQLQPAEHAAAQSSKVLAISAQAVSCAHALGLHHNDTTWDIPVWEKKLRRKLWWATYYMDRWTSVSHGRPSHIQNGTFDTGDIEVEDLVYDEDVAGHACSSFVREENHQCAVSSAVRFIERIKLTTLLDTALGCPS